MSFRSEKIRPIQPLLSEQTSRARQQSALADLSQRALQSKDPAVLFEDAVGLVAESLQVGLCDLLEIIPGQASYKVRAAIGFPEGYVSPTPIPLVRESQVAFTIHTERRVVVDDIHADTPYVPPEVLINQGVVSSLTVPILGDKSVTGIIGAHSSQKHIFTEDEINFLQALANVVAGAIQRIRYEEEMRESERYFRGLLESAPDGMAIVDKEGRMSLVNIQVERLFGYRRSELIGQPIEMLVPERYRTFHPRHRSDFAHEPHTRPMGAGLELFAVRKDGSEFPVEISLSPMQTSNGTVVTAAIRDISERRKAEAQIRRLNSQLEEALRRSDRLATTGRLAASIAHEINNPLEAITGVLFLLASSGLPPEQKDLVHTAQRELERLSDISRLTLEPHRDSKTTDIINVAELLEASCATFANKRERHKVELEKHFDYDAKVSANQRELRQVFTNLIANAIDVMPLGGRITLYVEKKDSSVIVKVADNGPGISAENIVQIFEPFFSTKGEKGLGLGLWISRTIIERMEGKIELTSSTESANRGTCFTVTLRGMRDTEVNSAGAGEQKLLK